MFNQSGEGHAFENIIKYMVNMSLNIFEKLKSKNEVKIAQIDPLNIEQYNILIVINKNISG